VLISIVDFNRLGGVVHWLLGNLAPIAAGPLAPLRRAGGGRLLARAASRPRAEPPGAGREAAVQLGVDAERLKRPGVHRRRPAHGHRGGLQRTDRIVGLVVPHLLRGVLGQDNRLLVPTALVGGGIFLLAADTLARNLVAPAELSVGVITSFLRGAGVRLPAAHSATVSL